MEMLTNAFISESHYHREFPACWEWLKCLSADCILYPNYVWILKVSPFLTIFSLELSSTAPASWNYCLYSFCFSIIFSKQIWWEVTLSNTGFQTKNNLFAQVPFDAYRYVNKDQNFPEIFPALHFIHGHLKSGLCKKLSSTFNAHINSKATVCSYIYFYHPSNTNLSFS